MLEWDDWILSTITLGTGLMLGLVGPWLRKLTKNIPPRDISLVLQLASVAVPLIERQFPALGGGKKLAKAVEMLSAWLVSRGIHLTTQELEGAVEKAWAEFEASGQAASYKKKRA